MLRLLRETFGAYGFVPLETPHIERLEVLTGKGAGSDEVLRQIFDVTNKGGEEGKLALRFDLTVPLARFIAKHVDSLGVPFKRYAIGAVFRGERPAKGRYREFTQCDFDTVGTESAVADAETIQVISASMTVLGVPGFKISVNNRKILDGFLHHLGVAQHSGPILRSLDKLHKIGREKVLGEISLTIGQGAGELADQPIPPSASEAGKILEFVEHGRGGIEVLDRVEQELPDQPLVKEGVANLRAIFELLEAGGVRPENVRVDLGLARGLDYYTGVVFETHVESFENFGSVCSGGRYDNLASLFTKRRLPGVGASIGLDRLIAVMEEGGWLQSRSTTVPILVANFPGTPAAVAMRLAARLRAAGIGAEVFPDPISLGKQLGYASGRGHIHAVIVGPDEQANEVFNLRDLATRLEEKGIPWSELETRVAQALAPKSTDSASGA